MMELPALRLLLRGYFTIDWPEDYGDPWLAVEDFAKSEPQLAPKLREEVDHLLATTTTEGELRNTVLNEFGSGYVAEADGWEYRPWLKEVVRRVDEELSR